MMAGAKGAQGEPDLGHFERFCNVVVPDLLTDVCHVGTELAARIGEDILARAESYAMLDDKARDVLIAPFAEEIARYEPAGSSLMLKGAVAVVVRSSLLEEAHEHGPVDAGGIQGITTLAAAPLSHFLAARRRNPVPVEDNLFADLADAWPRAWACLGAVAQAYGAGGGRWPYRFAVAPVPELPAAEVEAPSADSRDGVVILNGIDPVLTRKPCSACARRQSRVTRCGSLHRSAAFRGTWARSCRRWNTCSPTMFPSSPPIACCAPAKSGCAAVNWLQSTTRTRSQPGVPHEVCPVCTAPWRRRP
jgi:hypothetical protein